MALEGCITKMEQAGSPVAPDDITQLRQWVADGLTDTQAVNRLIHGSYREAVRILGLAQRSGATLSAKPQPLAEVINVQTKLLKGMGAEKTELNVRQAKVMLKIADVASVELKLKEQIGRGADLADMGQVMNALAERRFHPGNFGDTLESMGFKAINPLDMVREFIAMQASVAPEIAELEKIMDDQDRLEERIEAMFGDRSIAEIAGIPPHKEFQQTVEEPRLTVRHNLSASNLKAADGFGGLALPSLAITPEGMEFDKFGEITLIGDVNLGDPKKVVVHDADSYSATFPDAEYSRVKAATVKPLEDVLRPLAMEYQATDALYILDSHTTDFPNPQEIINKWLRNNAVRALFLTELGIEVAPKIENVKSRYGFSWSPSVLEFFGGDMSAMELAWEDPKRQAHYKKAGAAVRAGMKEHFAEVAEAMRPENRQTFIDQAMEKYAHWFDEEGALRVAHFDAVRVDALQKGRTKVADIDTTRYLEDLIRAEGLEHQFQGWIEAKVMGLFDPPFLTISGRKVAYTLANIVRKKKAKPLRGAERQFMETPGSARGEAAKRIRNLEALRDLAQSDIADRPLVEGEREMASERLLAWKDAAAPYYVNIDARGYLSHLDMSEDMLRAFAYWANHADRLGNNKAMQTGLERNGFQNVRDDVVARGVDAAKQWMRAPVPYFEATPRRAVKLSEFAGAVIPENASPETRAILQKNGVPYREYQGDVDPSVARQDAVGELMGQLERDGERVFFQRELEGFTSNLSNQVKTMGREKGTAQEMLATLKKQPGVSTLEIDGIGLSDYMLAKGGQITRDEMAQWIDNNGLRVEEVHLRRPPPIVFPDFKITAADQPVYEELGLDTDPDTLDRVTVWDVYDNRRMDSLYRVIEDKDAGNVSVQREDGTWLDIEAHAPINRQEMTHAHIAMEKDYKEQFTVGRPSPMDGETQYDTLQLPGEWENYREVVLKLPIPDEALRTSAKLTAAAEDMDTIDALIEDIEAELENAADLSLTPYTMENGRHTVAVNNWPRTSANQLWEILARPEYVGAISMENLNEYGDHTAPDVYTGGHFGTNTLAWFRAADRRGPKGERMLHLEEVQSSWHQDGARNEYHDPSGGREAAAVQAYQMKIAESEEAYRPISEVMRRFEQATKPVRRAEEGDLDYQNRLDSHASSLMNNIVERVDWRDKWISDLTKVGVDFNTIATPEEMDAIENWRSVDIAKTKAAGHLRSTRGKELQVPDAPFKGTKWMELVIKRVIRMAAEEGYDQITWTTGQQQADRYNLSNYASKISYDPASGFVYVDGVSSTDFADNFRASIDELPQYIGEELTARLERKINDIDRAYDIIPVSEMDAPITMLGAAQGSAGFVIVDANGELVNNSSGETLWGYSEDAMRARLYEVARANGSLPSLEGNELVVSGLGKRKLYDGMMVAAANKALKKLDKKARVDKFGGRIETGDKDYTSLTIGTNGAEDVANLKYRVLGKKYAEGYQVRIPGSPEFETYGEAAEWSDLYFQGWSEVHKIDITDEIVEGAMRGQRLFGQNERGSIRFNRQNEGIIRLTKARNLSTFLHEGGHLFLELMADINEMETASDRQRDDFAKVLTFLGVNSRAEIQTPQHEQFARAFEAYLMEGNAPSAELRNIFTAFKAWLTSVYRKIKLDATLDDEIRGVFDRLIATDEAISNAEATEHVTPIFATIEDSGMSPEAWAIYKNGAELAHRQEVDRLSQKMLQVLTREQKTWWEDELRKHRREVEVEAYDMPVYQALAMLQNGRNPDGTPSSIGPFKMDKQSLIDAGFDASFLKTLPRPWMYAREGGVDVGLVAQTFGFSSVENFIEALVQAPKMTDFIEAEARARMNQQHPDPATDGTLEAEAVTEVYNTKRMEILGHEMRALRKKAREDKPIVQATKAQLRREQREAREANKGQMPRRSELAAIKAEATEKIAGMSIRQVNPNRYLKAAEKAGRLAFEAAGKGDFQKAYDQKRRQIIQHALWAAASKRKDTSERQRTYLSKFDRVRVRRRLGRSDMLARIDALLATISLRRISGKQAEQQQAEIEKVRRQVENGEVIMDAETLDALGFKWQDVTDKDGNLTGETELVGLPTVQNWQDLTGSELDGITETVKQLEHIADNENKSWLNDRQIEFDATKGEVLDDILNKDPVAILRGTKKPTEDLQEWGRLGLSLWRRPGSIARLLDNADWGAMTKFVIVPIRRAMAEKLLPGIEKAANDVAAIYDEHYDRAELKRLQKGEDRIFIDALDQTMSKANRLAIALNWGNEGNRAALQGGVMHDDNLAYPEAALKQIISSLTARDWAFVQDTWDYLDTYRAELFEAERRRRGVAPQKVEPVSWTQRTSDGLEIEVRGGYYPLKYDLQLSKKGETLKQTVSEDIFKKLGFSHYVAATTRAGATHNRVQNHGLVVRPELGIIESHLREIIRDISLGDEISFIKKLLDDPDIRNAFKRTGQENDLKALELWLTDSAVGELAAQDPITRGVSWIRTGFTLSKIGWNLATSLLQFTGHFQTMSVLGVDWWGIGLRNALEDLTGSAAMVMQKSHVMRVRYNQRAFDKDAHDASRVVENALGEVGIPTKGKRALRNMGKIYMYPIMKAQQTVDTVVWMGALAKGMEPGVVTKKGLDEAEAILYADSVVENAQTLGFFTERSGIERGTLSVRSRQNQFVRLFTTLIGYMLAKGNIAAEHQQRRYRRYKAGEIGALSMVARLAGDILLLFTLEGMASSLIYQRWPEGDDEPDEPYWWQLIKFAGRETAGSMISTVPIVREYDAAKYRSGTTPIGAFAVDLSRAHIQSFQGELDRPLIKAYSDVVGTMFHLPMNQVYRSSDALWADVREGEDVTFYEYLTGRRD